MGMLKQPTAKVNEPWAGKTGAIAGVDTHCASADASAWPRQAGRGACHSAMADTRSASSVATSASARPGIRTSVRSDTNECKQRHALASCSGDRSRIQQSSRYSVRTLCTPWDMAIISARPLVVKLCARTSCKAAACFGASGMPRILSIEYAGQNPPLGASTTRPWMR